MCLAILWDYVFLAMTRCCFDALFITCASLVLQGECTNSDGMRDAIVIMVGAIAFGKAWSLRYLVSLCKSVGNCNCDAYFLIKLKFHVFWGGGQVGAF